MSKALLEFLDVASQADMNVLRDSWVDGVLHLNTPLINAIKEGQAEAVEALVSLKADVSICGREKSSAASTERRAVRFRSPNIGRLTVRAEPRLLRS